MASLKTGHSHKWALRIGAFLSKLMGRRSSDGKTGITTSAQNAITPPFQLYGHCWDFNWWKNCANSLSPKSQVHCLRLFGKPEFDRIIKRRAGVRRLRGFELLFSRTLARASSLIAVVIEKCEDSQMK
jgi:hypothetical protein